MPGKITAALVLLPLFFLVNASSTQSSAPLRGVASAHAAPVDTRPGYMGDQACARCHQREAASYAHTGHKLTSQYASAESILGNFHPGANVLTISNPATDPAEPALFFKMESSSKGFTETAATGWGGDLQTRTEHIDVVTGSGNRGQTYLYWQNNGLFELPVSYWTDGKRWINSPGYQDGTADFSRPINPGCLECHATYVRALSSDALTNSYQPGSLVPGISCETCHGPGSTHVAQHSGGATDTAQTDGAGIVNPAKLERDRQMDACALCHGGTQREALTPAFSFSPGHKLSDYFHPLPAAVSDHPDVHGNQVGLLERSRCYQSSATLTCSTCHDVHAPEKTAASYSLRCLTCHQWTSCGRSKALGHSIVNQCVNCHMPVEETNLIVSETAGKEVRARMRNHWIKVYASIQKPGT